MKWVKTKINKLYILSQLSQLIIRDYNRNLTKIANIIL